VWAISCNPIDLLRCTSVTESSASPRDCRSLKEQVNWRSSSSCKLNLLQSFEIFTRGITKIQIFLNVFVMSIGHVAVQIKMETSELHVDENPIVPSIDEHINSNRIYIIEQSNTAPHKRCAIYTDEE